MSTPADPFLLYGTQRLETEPIRLAAGRLSADLVDGNLRTIRYDGVEVLRAVSYIVRDRDWGTYSPDIAELAIEQTDGAFTVGYVATCKGPEATDLGIRVRITANADGTLRFDADALSANGFETNRCGFCILHPIVGVAGTPATVEHVDGRRVDTFFPDLIDPWQPFKDMRAITHTVMPGVTVECCMEGDTFEMEDQRNWSDASYKTYVRPLALPWPYRIAPATPLRQTVTLRISDKRSPSRPVAATGSTEPPVMLRRGSKQGRMPSIGLIVNPEDAKATIKASSILADIAPQELLFHFDPVAGHGREALADFAAIAASHPGRSTLEIALPCRRAPAEEAAGIAALMRDVGFRPDAVMVSPSVDRQSTPPGSRWPDCPPLDEVYAGARAAFPDIRLGGGMLSYFTELNRKRVPPDQLDFVTHCTNPIVHAADDRSVMQTLEALPFIVRSVRAIYGDKPYRIGPSTIAMRQNPYGSRTMDNPEGGRIPMARTDPRHNGLFGEAFALAYAASVLDGELECLTLSALTGPFGLIAGRGEPMPEGAPRPIFRAVKTLARLAGTDWHECISSAPGRILAFEAGPASAPRLHLVNVTAREQSVDLGDFAGAGGQAGRLLTLTPYATAAVMPAH